MESWNSFEDLATESPLPRPFLLNGPVNVPPALVTLGEIPAGLTGRLNLSRPCAQVVIAIQSENQVPGRREHTNNCVEDLSC